MGWKKKRKKKKKEKEQEEEEENGKCYMKRNEKCNIPSIFVMYIF